MQQKTSIRVTLVSHFGPCGWKGLHFFTALLATTHEAVVGIGFQGINNDDWKMLIDNWFQRFTLFSLRPSG